MAESLGDLQVSIKVDASSVDAALSSIKKKMEDNRKEAERLEAEFRAGKITAIELADGLREVATQGNALTGQFRSIETAAGRARSGLAGLGQTFMQTGRFAQDFAQGGVGGVINNIEGLVQSLGMGPGLAGILTLVGVGFLALKPKIQEWLNSLDSHKVDEFKGRLESLEELIKVLEKKEVKLYVDDLAIRESRKEVERLRADFDELQAAMGRQTLEERASGAAVERATTGEEFRTAEGRAVEERRKELEKNSGDILANRGQQEAAAAHIARLNEMKKDAKNAEQLQDILSDITKEEGRLKTLKDDERKIRGALARKAQEELGGLLRQARTGVGAGQIEAQARLRQVLGRQGPEGAAVAEKLAKATPEGVRQQKLLEAKIKAENEQEEESIKEGAHAAQKAARDAKTAKDKADRQAKAAKDKADREAQQAHEKEINAEIAKYGGKFGKGLQAAMLGHRMRGMTAEKSDASLERQLAARLQEVPGEQRAEVARGIVEKARLEFAAQQAAMGIAPAVAPPPKRRMTTGERKRLEMEQAHARNRQRATRRTTPRIGVGTAPPSVAIPGLQAPTPPAMDELPAVVPPNIDLGVPFGGGGGGADGGAGNNHAAAIRAGIDKLVALQTAQAKPQGPRPIALVGNTA